ncbi:MAG: P-loop NTPase family protein [Methanotrichaceae archaeon]
MPALLELMAQMVILAHMGMPVPAVSCKLSLFQEFYYFSKSKGTLGAGAFEATIRKFSVVANKRKKLVLADELEAITEPGASAKIIASLLDELARGESVAVFVSHLAEEVQRFVKTKVRIDGIESQGLDQKNSLIVDRNPRYNHLARSTPELIIDSLVRTTSGQEQMFYSRLLKKFE